MIFKQTSYGDLTGKVAEDINLNSVGLTSLEGSPKICSHYYVGVNKLKNLKHAPKEVKRTMVVSGNPLTSLEGIPKKIGTLMIDVETMTKEDILTDLVKYGVEVKEVHLNLKDGRITPEEIKNYKSKFKIGKFKDFLDI